MYYKEFSGKNVRFFQSDVPFALENGAVLPFLTIAYHTYGRLAPSGDNVIWVCHALTANSDVADWWPNTVVEGGLLDPSKYFIVCANKLGSCYGTTGPLSENPATGKPYYMDFPLVTIRDMVGAHKLLADHLGIGRIRAIIGGSTGGCQAMEWAIDEPDRFDVLSSTVTSYKTSPWVVANSEAQRMSLRADKTLFGDDPQGGKEGLAAARALSMLIYRNAVAFNATQADPEEKLTDFRAASYQRYQGLKLSKRFDARCYYKLLDALDSHDVGRGRGGAEKALGRIKARSVIMSIDSDIMFPSAEIETMARMIPGADYFVIHSDFGHDGFLIETSVISEILKKYL